MGEATEFTCDETGVRYWSNIERMSAERLDGSLQRWRVVPAEKCPWCRKTHVETHVAPAGSEPSQTA